MKNVPAMTHDSSSQALGLPDSVSLDDFILYNIVEGLLYGVKGSRIAKETNQPLLGDLGDVGAGANVAREYVRS